MIIKTNAIVIKEQTVGESDKLLTLLTADEGVIKAFARRAKNIKDNKNSATALLSYSHFSIYKGRDKYIIDDASSIEVFFGLRSDIVILSLAQYFCELASIFVQENVNSNEFLRLVLNSIAFLSKGKKDIFQLKAITELRILSLSGFMPNLVACKDCACYENDLWNFLPHTGEIICSNCLGESDYRVLKMSQSVLTAMRHIIYSDFNKIYSFELSENECKRLSLISEEYLLSTIGKMPMTLDFFKKMC